MMKRLLLSLVLIATIGVPMSATWAAVELPQAPKGYSWKRVDDVGCAVLIPKGWSYRGVQDPASFDIFVTPKKIRRPEEFRTGLKITAINAIDRRSKMTAWDYAKLVIGDYEKKHRVEQRWAGDEGALRTVGILFSQASPDGNQTVHVHILANQKTQTLYITVLVGWTSEWEATMRTGAVILTNFVFNPEF